MDRQRKTDVLKIGLFSTCAVFAVTAAAQVPPPPSTFEPAAVEIPPHMPEETRAAVKKLVVISGRAPTQQDVTGTYEKETLGLVGGMDAGSRMGTISKEVGGVPINIPIPGLALPGAIFGGLSGLTKRQLQEFRDALTEEIVNADSPPLRSDGLAIDAFWGVRRLPQIDSNLFSINVEISEDTDAVLYIAFDDLVINVDGSDALITAAARGILRRHSDGHLLYETVVHYEDRDTLKNWTANDNALWRDYTNYARFFLGREVAEDIFGRVYVDHRLQPEPTENTAPVKKRANTLRSDSLTPTLAWRLELTGEDGYPWTKAIGEADVSYDIEIFDDRQLVYDAQNLPEPTHTLGYELEGCREYRWSVRPSYHIDGEVRHGEWMRFAPVEKKSKKKDADEEQPLVARKGVFGRRASDAPAYTQDFATLELDCP